MANIISKIKASNVDYAIRAGYMYYGKTSGTASALTVTITDTNNQTISIPELVRGMVLVLTLNVVPTESATLSVNGLTAKPIQHGVGEGGTKWSIDETYIFIYNGSAFVAISNYDDYTVTTTGSGNAITSISKNGKTITATKGTIFLTEHPTISKSTDTTSTQSVAHQDSFTVVDSVTRDSDGHVTKINTKTVSLQTPKSLTVGGKTYDGSAAVTINASDLGLDSALKYHGVTTTALTDGATTNPIVINGANHTATTGCVVFYGSKEFVFNGSKWYELGDGSNHKIKQTAVASPSASGSTTAFIDTISQDANGVITATKKNVSVNITANATDDDVVILTGSGDTNSVTYVAKHAQKGPSSGYTSGNTTTSISGYGASATIKIPQLTVDKYGHVTAAADESVTITMPSAQSIPAYYAGTGLALVGGNTFKTTVTRKYPSPITLPGANTFVVEEYYQSSDNNIGLPSNSWYHIYTAQGDDVKYGTQLAVGMTSVAIYYRCYSQESWGNWISLINTDTKVTNTKNNTTTFYLTGTTSASTNTGTQIFDSTVYVSGTEGQLHAKELQAENSVQVGNSFIQYNSTTGCLEIIT